MRFYDLRQSGAEVQNLLDSMQNLDISLKDIEDRINNIPVVNINEKCDISSKIVDSGIYCILSVNIDKDKITPTTLPINSQYSIIIHLQSTSNYRSQYLITQDENMNIIIYKRNTDSNGNWTEFVNPQEDQKNEILGYLKIKSFSQRR